MIRQKKNRAFLQKSSYKFDNSPCFHQDLTKHDNNSENQIFQEGILNKILKININNQNPLKYTSKGRMRQVVRKPKPILCVKGVNVSKQISNKENFLDDSFDKVQNKSKLILLHKIGNVMVPLVPLKSIAVSQQLRHKRPYSAVSSCRLSLKSQNLQNSLSRVLQQLVSNDINKNKQKISTSKALVLFSKVVKNHQIPPRPFYQKRLKSSSTNDRYRSVSIMASKAIIQVKDQKKNNKIDYKRYLDKFRPIRAQNKNRKLQKSMHNADDFELEGWDTSQVDFI